MAGRALSESFAAPARRGASWCEECGYHLRGLPSGQACPECGHVPPEAAQNVSPQTGWSRTVFAGLALLLGLTIHGTCAVLVQPFTYDMGGATTALNLPGPKVWAVPLILRPIGYSPQSPGVSGTRTALLGLVAIWLITVPSRLEGARGGEISRLLTRWVSLIGFGLLFGALTARQGMTRADTMLGFRALLIGCVELPGTAALYFYLRRLAGHVTGRERREAFDRLVWLVPLTIGAAAAILGVQYFFDATQQYIPSARLSRVVGASYGMVTIVCGVAATATVASLAGAFFQLAFPRAGQWLAGGRYLSRCAAAAGRAVPDHFARRLAVATGALLLILLMVIGNDLVLWMITRQGVGGNLPFMNFPGPKVWAGVTLGSGTRYYSWEPVATRATFLFLHLVALWLVSVPLRSGEGGRLRQPVRWMPAVCLGAGTGAIMVFEELFPNNAPRGRFRSEVFALITVLLEMPATLLLYALLARVAREVGRPALAQAFRRIAMAIICLVGGSFVMFVVSRRLLSIGETPVVLVACAIYGAAEFAAAAWATGTLIRLAGALVVTPATEPRQPLMLEVGPSTRVEKRTAPMAAAVLSSDL